MRTLRLERRDVPATRSRAWPETVHPVLQRIYAARGATDPPSVEHRLARLHAPSTLTGLERATSRLARAIANGEHVLIAGDYDCDGATGVAVAVRGLRMLGAAHVGYVIPNRFAHGYGLSPGLVDSLSHMPDATQPDLIVTVDNGIASVDGVATARARGIDVIVTDHHLPGERLPDACAIVNPNLPGDAFPSKALAGVGVMFYLLLALRAKMYPSDRPDREDQKAAIRGRTFQKKRRPDLSSLLDLVALGTVADMVPLDFNNRVLVESGLRRMRTGRACAGIAALAEAGGRSMATLVALDLGFALAPRLNAAGRLEDMTLGVECLLSDDPGEAAERARMLSAINSERRDLQSTMVADADAMVADVAVDSMTGVVVSDPGWHAGVVGLVASKLKERLHRPVVAFAPADETGSMLRGSARSIPGFHIRDALAAVDAMHPGMLGRFGGHAMAAGLGLARDRLEDFAKAFDRVARARIAAEHLEPVLWTDGELDPGDCSLELAHALRYAGPWGQAFPPPIFDNVFECVQHRSMGESGKHLRLQLRDPRDGAVLNAVMFNVPADLSIPPLLRAAYELNVNDWQGRESAQLLVRHIEAV